MSAQSKQELEYKMAMGTSEKAMDKAADSTVDSLGNNLGDNTHTTAEQQLPVVYEQFRYLYQHYMQMMQDGLQAVYAENIVFRDPVHEIHGLPALQRYFGSVSQNLLECQFNFEDEVVTDHSAHITWTMLFRHPQIQRGRVTEVRGMTLIRFDEKIHYHEDVYDLGAMVYDHLPLVGRLTRSIKKRLAG